MMQLLCGWESNRRSIVALAMCQRLSIPTTDSMAYDREMSSPSMVQYGLRDVYMYLYLT